MDNTKETLRHERFVDVRLENPLRPLSLTTEEASFSVCSVYFCGGLPVSFDAFKVREKVSCSESGRHPTENERSSSLSVVRSHLRLFSLLFEGGDGSPEERVDMRIGRRAATGKRTRDFLTL